MDIQIYLAALTYASIIVLMTEAFTLTYSLTDAPNFTIGAILSIGGYASFTNYLFLGYPLYLGLPLAFVVGSIVSLFCVLLVIEPLVRRKRDPVQITVALLGLQILLTAILGVYVEHVKRWHYYSTSIMLKTYDLVIGDVRGVTIVSLIIAIASALLFRTLSRGSNIGVSLRAICEDDELAQVQGVNTRKYRIGIWVLAGGLAGLSGSMFLLYFHLNPSTGPYMMTTIIASSLIGGIGNPERAIIGGMIMGTSDILLTVFGLEYLGPWVGDYRPLFSIVALALLMNYYPQGFFRRKFESVEVRAFPNSQ